MPEFIKTRGGRDLNVDILSPGEVKQIKRTRGITPQEFVRSEEDDFVFLVRDRESGVRREVRIGKTNENGAFQGLFEAADGRLIVFRSTADSKLQESNHLNAFTAESAVGRIADGYLCAEFIASWGRHGNVDLQHREVAPDSERLGVGSEMVDRFEKASSAAGATRLTVPAVWVCDTPPQEGVRRLLEKKGYKLIQDKYELSMLRHLPKAPEDGDMTMFHKFPVNPSGRRRYYSEPIKQNKK